ncbi:MAG: NAD(P) transhydrogenase subunit alpha [Myxococcota bacterium]|jgi:NAD(P) transhydrogenase subunit alpha
MIVGVPRESGPGERRVAATPDTVRRLIALGFEVQVQAGAGKAADLPDAQYVEAGAALIESSNAVFVAADLLLKVEPPSPDEIAHLTPGTTVISLLYPDVDGDRLQALADRGVSALALDKIPRITRAQAYDVLSSMANIAGYRAVIEAANRFGRFFAGQITAAGKSPPAKVLVIGAGVAGLAAIAAARSLGAVVRAFDVRPAAKEQVESLGADFLMLDFEESGDGGGGYAKLMSDEFIAAEMALFAAQAAEVDIIITTALIPGRRAPVLITSEMVASMSPGSVVVDLAARQGGNCEATVPGQVVVVDGVTIIGLMDLTSHLPTHASQFFGQNLVNLLRDLGGGEAFALDPSDEVVRKSVCVRDGAVTWPPPPDPEPPPAPAGAQAQVEAAPKLPPAPVAVAKPGGHGHSSGGAGVGPVTGLVGAAILGVVGMFAPTEFIQHFTVFVLACFVGWQVVWSVTPALHTPLMSVTNAISGIIVVGGLIQAGTGALDVGAALGLVAIFVASINVVGGFLVTHRMLGMFRREG